MTSKQGTVGYMYMQTDLKVYMYPYMCAWLVRASCFSLLNTCTNFLVQHCACMMKL